MKVSKWIGGAVLAVAMLGTTAVALAQDTPEGAAAPTAEAAPVKKKAKAGEALSGNWTGTFVQVGHPQAYRMAIQFSGKSAEIDYPDQSCGGKLARVGAKDDTSFYIETITRGGVDPATGHGCVGGNVTLIRAGESLIWGWVGEHQGKPIVAYATLTKAAE